MFAILPQPIQIVVEHIAIVMRQAVVGDYPMQRVDYLVEFAFIVTMMLQAPLQFIQFMPGAFNSVLIVTARKPAMLDAIQVFAYLREKMHAPAFTFPASLLRVRSGCKKQKAPRLSNLSESFSSLVSPVSLCRFVGRPIYQNRFRGPD